MGIFSRFEGKVEDTFEGAADKMFDAPISPVQIAKKAEKQMRREKMVGAGKQYAPTLYTVLVNPDDDRRLFGYYPTLAGETETYLAAKASEQGLVMDGQPLVRFIVDEGLKHGKFDVIAEAVAAPIIAQLRDEEMQRYGLAPQGGGYGAAAAYPAQQYGRAAAPAPAAAPAYDDYGQQGGWGQQQPAQPYGQDAAYDGYDVQGGYGYAEPAAGGYDGYGQPAYAEAGDAADQYLFPNAAPAAAAAPAAGAAAGFAAAPAAAAPAAAAGFAAGAGAAAAAAAPQAAAAANTVVFAGGQAAPGAAMPAARARLIDTASNRTYDLAGTNLTIGRESKNPIAIQDINVSRTHAELRLDPQGVWVLTDLGSTNGTYVNGRAIASQALAEGDRISLGMTNLVFTQA